MATPFHAQLVTPERVLFSGEVDEVTMRTDEGEISFLAAHEDYVAAADITVVGLNVRGPGLPGGAPVADDGSGQLLRAAVHGGFVQVDREGVTILASVAELQSEIDVERARRSLERAEQDLASGGGQPGGAGAGAGAGGPGGPALSDGQPAGAAMAAQALAVPSPAMLALLDPDAPVVRARRARARLAAAGAL